jgi:2'-5' RNA ligase
MHLPSAPNGAPRQYALVGYIPDPLGAFLNQLRRSLVEGSQLLSHVTLLPPRLLASPQKEIVEELGKRLEQVSAFEIEVGDVELFPVTEVIYLSIRRGKRQLAGIHTLLNGGRLAFDEPFEFHPHVTLAQQLPSRAVPDALDKASLAWRRWKGSRRTTIANLTLVRSLSPGSWETVTEHLLQPLSLPRIT